jgi:hypothetical protein
LRQALACVSNRPNIGVLGASQRLDARRRARLDPHKTTKKSECGTGKAMEREFANETHTGSTGPLTMSFAVSVNEIGLPACVKQVTFTDTHVATRLGSLIQDQSLYDNETRTERSSGSGEAIAPKQVLCEMCLTTDTVLLDEFLGA